MQIQAGCRVYRFFLSFSLSFGALLNVHRPRAPQNNGVASVVLSLSSSFEVLESPYSFESIRTLRFGVPLVAFPAMDHFCLGTAQGRGRIGREPSMKKWFSANSQTASGSAGPQCRVSMTADYHSFQRRQEDLRPSAFAAVSRPLGLGEGGRGNCFLRNRFPTSFEKCSNGSIFGCINQSLQCNAMYRRTNSKWYSVSFTTRRGLSVRAFEILKLNSFTFREKNVDKVAEPVASKTRQRLSRSEAMREMESLCRATPNSHRHT